MLSKSLTPTSLRSDCGCSLCLADINCRRPLPPILPLKSGEDASQLNCHYGTFCSDGFYLPGALGVSAQCKCHRCCTPSHLASCSPKQVNTIRNSSSLCAKRSLYSAISHPYRFWSWRPSLPGLLSYLRSGLPSSRCRRSSETRPSRLGLRLLDLGLA